MTAGALDDVATERLGNAPGDYRAPCPKCAKAGRDDAVSVTVNVDGTVVAHCHRCGKNGIAKPSRVNGAARPAARTRAASDFAALWASGVEPEEAFEHPYLTRKQVQAHGIRIAGDLLLIPMLDSSGGIVGVQRIDAGGTKLFVKGSRKVGASHIIGDITDKVVIAEGYATASSIFEATNIATVVAFDCGNLTPVAKVLRAKNPKLRITIAADDDSSTTGNPGMTKATEAARAVGGLLAVPEFGADRPEDATDFNDLARHRGAEAVRRAVANARKPGTGDHQTEPQRGAAHEADREQKLEDELSSVLDDVVAFVGRFVAMPARWCLDAVALWAAHAHMVAHFHTSPRLAAISPEPESGKSRLLEVIATVTPEPMLMLSPTSAAVFRKLGQGQVTLLFDQCDTVFSFRGKNDQNEDLRALINAGYRRGATIPRCVGPRHDVQDFPVFAATALAGIGDLPDTVMTRAIVMRMRRRTAAEPVEQYRIRKHESEGHELRDRLGRCAEVLGRAAGEAWPALPDGIVDRRAEAWEPLTAIADLAGGNWPDRARAAAVADVAAYRGREPSLGIKLLIDIRTAMGDLSAIASEDLVAKLVAMEESPWGNLRGRPLDQRGLAFRLGKYGVKSGNVRTGQKVPKGYRREDLHDVWTRYLSYPLEAATGATSAAERPDSERAQDSRPRCDDAGSDAKGTTPDADTDQSEVF